MATVSVSRRPTSVTNKINYPYIIAKKTSKFCYLAILIYKVYNIRVAIAVDLVDQLLMLLFQVN